MSTIDGNEAAAYIAYKLSEVIAIYPITPSTTMAELAESWAVLDEVNIWGMKPIVRQMQSEGGAAGTCHGALQTGALTTTFTASQGLLLMIPNLYKIAGELTSAVFHVAARSLATQGLSIFGDHSDVMAIRQTGWAILFSNSVQESMDLALVAHAATLKSRIPFIHAFDGFRTSHEVMKVEQVSEEAIRGMIEDELVREHRRRALSPDHPFIRGTAQNPDVYFQARETCNPYYLAIPNIIQEAMDRFKRLTGRTYSLFQYSGAPDAERVVVAMGSACQTLEETVEALNAKGEKTGLLKVRLYRPFSARHFLAALPKTVKSIAVLDRTKEPGSAGEPLYTDAVTALFEAASLGFFISEKLPRAIGGRYGLSSKEFTPAMAKAVLDELKKETPKNHFTIGIQDDVTHTSLEFDPHYVLEPEGETRAIFWGLGSDGTVGANKNSIKIIGEQEGVYAQGYFVYDSKKSGSVTISHLRFGKNPIRSPYLIQKANFVAVHQFGLVDRFPILERAADGAILLLNSPVEPEKVWERLPGALQKEILRKKIRLYTMDGYSIAKASGVGQRINTIMQTGFFILSGVLSKEEAVVAIKKSIQKSYGKRGDAVIKNNFDAVDAAVERITEITLPQRAEGSVPMRSGVAPTAPEFVRKVSAEMLYGRGDDLPVSAFPVDGTYPSATSQWEKRSIAEEIPVWESDLCIQCGKCVLVCPHAVIRSKIYDASELMGAPKTFKNVSAKWREWPGKQYSLQVSPMDCTGCGICVDVCPAKDKSNSSRKAINMKPKETIETPESLNWDFFMNLPDVSPVAAPVQFDSVKNIQLLRPLFEFSGACAGCGETPYLKLLSQLFGDRAVIANATGCSSIYGGNLPTTPWAKNAEGRGPAWSNSLFEDNAEFGLGFRLALDQHSRYAGSLLRLLHDKIGSGLVDEILNASQDSEDAIARQRERILEVKKRLGVPTDPLSKDLLAVVEALVEKSVWIVGGDGWAYDIGYGGLDHVLAGNANVNILVLDTEVYSNTGGQASKATSRGAVAKFAAGGKETSKKDLGLMAMAYGHVYVAQIAVGANDSQTVRAFLEAQSYNGPSLIIAYSHCIAHGIDMQKGMTQQKMAVRSGYWPIYRYDPRLAEKGVNPFQMDCPAPSIPLKEYLYSEARFRILYQSDKETANRLFEQADQDRRNRWRLYEKMLSSELSSREALAVSAPKPEIKTT